MPPRKLLIADEDQSLLDQLNALFFGRYLIKTCTDGMQAQQIVREWDPDILLLDLELRRLDGISLLKQIGKDGFSPVVLVATGFYNKYIQETMQELNVAYLMRKPCNLEALAARVGDMNRRLRPEPPSVDDLMNPTTRILTELGFASNRDGFRYLQAGIPLLTLDRNQRYSKELYPAIGRQCGGNNTQIEKDIRESIQAAWKQRNDQTWSKYFTPDRHGTIPHQTNTSFISTLADHLITHYTA